MPYFANRQPFELLIGHELRKFLINGNRDRQIRLILNLYDYERTGKTFFPKNTEPGATDPTGPAAPRR